MNNTPLIVGFVADLMFATRIEQTATKLGYTVRWFDSAAAVGEGADTTQRPGEALHGRALALQEQLSRWQPALIVFDLGNDGIPWRAWIAKLKSSPATRRLPVLCYGPHVDETALKDARGAGADIVVSRGRFANAMAQLLQQHARHVDRDAIEAACAEPLSADAQTGIDLFNAGNYYEAHHSLEDAWNADQGPARDLYRAILQVAVAYYQIERGNYNGGLKMCLRVRQWLEPLPDVCRGVDIAALRNNVDRVYTALTDLGREHVADFDKGLFEPVRQVS